MSGRDGQVNGQEMMGCVDSSRWARSEKLHAFIKVVHFRTLLWSFQDRTGREYQLDIMILWSPRWRVIVKFKCRFYFYRAQKILRKNWINHDMNVPETAKSIFILDGPKSVDDNDVHALLDDPSQQGDRCLFRPLNSSFCVLPWSPPLCFGWPPQTLWDCLA